MFANTTILNKLKNSQKESGSALFCCFNSKTQLAVHYTLYKSQCEIFTARREVRLEQSGINENSSEERGEARITKQYPYHCSVWGVSYRCGATEKRKLTPDNEQAYMWQTASRHIVVSNPDEISMLTAVELYNIKLRHKISLIVPINLFYLIKLFIEKLTTITT